MTTIILTSASSSPWTVPGDFDATNNTIEAIGGGGGGAGGKGGTIGLTQGRPGNGGGGGGEYRKIANFSPSGGTVAFTIGTGGAGSAGTPDANTDPSSGTAGNATVWDDGSLLTANGGSGGIAGTGSAAGTGGAGGTGGTGAAANFNGGAGGAGSIRSGAAGGGGGGGGGAGGTTGAGSTGAAGTSGGNGGAGGAGGTANGGSAGAAGTFSSGNGGVGGDGTVWTTDGAGGGGGGGAAGAQDAAGGAGAAGGEWGAGGGGGGGGGEDGAGGNGGDGNDGVIVITYTPLAGGIEAEGDFVETDPGTMDAEVVYRHISDVSMVETDPGTMEATAYVGGSVPVITLARSTFTTAPHHFYARSDSSVIGGDGTTYNANYFWLLETAAGTEIARGYLPEFSRGIETAGDYVLHLGIRGDGEETMVFDSTSFTVGTATYQAECWVDLDAVSNGVGTEGDPFNNLPSGWSYIDTNWVAGASNEHAIHVKKGTSATIGSALFQDNLQGRLVIDTYGSGAKPVLTFTSVVIRWIQTIDDMALALNGFEFVGSETWPSISADQFIQSTVDQGNSPDGHNLMILNCDVSLVAGPYVNATIDDSDFYTSGTADFVLFQNNTWHQCFVGALFADVRYLTIVGDEHGEMSSTYWIRRGGFQHTYQCDTNQTDQYGGSVSYRLHAHANAGNLDSDGAYLERCRAIGPWWIGPDDGNGGAVNDLLNVYMLGCTSGDGTQPASPFGGSAFQPNGIGVLRNCVLRRGLNDTASVLYVRPNGNSDNMDTLVIDNCVFLHSYTGTGSNTICSYGGVTFGNIILRNNILWTPQTGGTTTWFSAAGSSPYGVTESDANFGDTAGSTLNWWPSTSLAAWQAATVFDDSSVSGSDPDLVNPDTPPVDVTPNEGSPVLDVGVDSPAWIDFNGFLRVSGEFDIGAVELGANVEPSVPSGGTISASSSMVETDPGTMAADVTYRHVFDVAMVEADPGTMASTVISRHFAEGLFIETDPGTMSGGGGSSVGFAGGSAPVPVTRSRPISRSPWMQWPIWEK